MANEKRLIDANELTHFVEERAGGAWIYKPDFLWAVRQQPTVDAVKVVRCKNCHYWDKTAVNGKGFRICPASGMDITPDDFCSYGERKDNDAEN